LWGDSTEVEAKAGFLDFKEPFSPDWNDTYERAKAQIHNPFKQILKVPAFNFILDPDPIPSFVLKSKFVLYWKTIYTCLP
jgi:hypothetical protein